ncbi:unnamed protein product [Caenorhabditis angaria]|uniref:Uncharacterized protein n=1 Tax=Caenorhabditis angaria TaxID=860376 RepID=A0A9P1ID09_9PELO|nr:unnamed protein product [Caenorhabditis angaria]
MNTSNNCITIEQLQVYESKLYFTILLWNCFIAMITLVTVTLGIRKLLKKSILPSSIRTFLIISLIFGMIHQIAYFWMKIRLIFRIFSHDPCAIPEISFDCRFISTGTLAGNCGIILIQSFMSIDRFIATWFSRFYAKFQHILTGAISLVIVYNGQQVICIKKNLENSEKKAPPSQTWIGRIKWTVDITHQHQKCRLQMTSANNRFWTTSD